jgi:hypothetical protein
MENNNQDKLNPLLGEGTKLNLTNNQTTPSPNQTEIFNLQKSLKSESKYVMCPYCKYKAMTQIEKKCSVSNTLCGALSLILPWLIFQACRGKDLSCYNAEHFCTRCHNKLATYQAC